MFIDTNVGSRVALQWYPFKGKGVAEKHLKIQPTHVNHIYISGHSQTGKPLKACLHLSCACVCGGGGWRGVGWLPQLDFTFRVFFRICDAKNETICMKFSTPKYLINLYKTCNRKPFSRLSSIHHHYTIIHFYLVFFVIIKIIILSNRRPQNEDILKF
jgi:hypothetical protein